MNLYKKDYTKLYQLQDKFLDWWKSLGMPLYLTGGTALGRFYLNHRFSEDLDFFTNSATEYSSTIPEIRKKITSQFTIDIARSLFSDDHTRFFISEDDVFLKIDFVHDVDHYAGTTAHFLYGKIDRPLNILSNKLTAIISRDEPKDIFDIIHIALKYSFNWPDVFNDAKQKAVINEIDVEQRLHSFPIASLHNVDWLNKPIDFDVIQMTLQQISDDFLLGKQNSLGKGKTPIELAKPVNS